MEVKLSWYFQEFDFSNGIKISHIWKTKSIVLESIYLKTLKTAEYILTDDFHYVLCSSVLFLFCQSSTIDPVAWSPYQGFVCAVLFWFIVPVFSIPLPSSLVSLKEDEV